MAYLIISMQLFCALKHEKCQVSIHVYIRSVELGVPDSETFYTHTIIIYMYVYTS